MLEVSPDPFIRVQLGRVAGQRDDLDPVRRRGAIDRAPNHPAAERLLLAALGDPAGEVRRAAVRALARRGGVAASRAIATVSGYDPSPAVRAEAVTALAQLLRRHEPER